MNNKESRTSRFSAEIPQDIINAFMESCEKNGQQPEDVITVLMLAYIDQADQPGVTDFSAEYILESGCGSVDGFTRDDILRDLDAPDLD